MARSMTAAVIDSNSGLAFESKSARNFQYGRVSARTPSGKTEFNDLAPQVTTDVFCYERRSAAMTRVLLFLSSYLPLFTVLAVIGGGTSKIIAYALVVTSALSW